MQIVVRSDKPRNLDDLKNMISFQAVDQQTGQSLLLDGRSIFVPTLKLIDDNDEKPGLVPSLDGNGDKKVLRFEPISVAVSPLGSKRFLY